MRHHEAVAQLKDLLKERKSLLDGDDNEYDDIILRDIEALMIAVYVMERYAD